MNKLQLFVIFVMLVAFLTLYVAFEIRMLKDSINSYQEYYCLMLKELQYMCKTKGDLISNEACEVNRHIGRRHTYRLGCKVYTFDFDMNGRPVIINVKEEEDKK